MSREHRRSGAGGAAAGEPTVHMAYLSLREQETIQVVVAGGEKGQQGVPLGQGQLHVLRLAQRRKDPAPPVRGGRRSRAGSLPGLGRAVPSSAERRACSRRASAASPPTGLAASSAEDLLCSACQFLIAGELGQQVLPLGSACSLSSSFGPFQHPAQRQQPAAERQAAQVSVPRGRGRQFPAPAPAPCHV